MAMPHVSPSNPVATQPRNALVVALLRRFGRWLGLAITVGALSGCYETQFGPSATTAGDQLTAGVMQAAGKVDETAFV